MAYSTIPAAKAQIVTTLAATTGLAGVLIQRGVPAEVPPNPERVYVDNAVDIDRAWNMIGRRRLDESYTIRIPVEVYQDGDDQAATETRMWAIIAEVELALVADTTLAGVLNGNTDRPSGVIPGGIDEQNSFAMPDGWVSQAVLRIDCAARI